MLPRNRQIASEIGSSIVSINIWFEPDPLSYISTAARNGDSSEVSPAGSASTPSFHITGINRSVPERIVREEPVRMSR